jgi:hypothetical protein
MLCLQWQPLWISYLTTLRLTITSKTCIIALPKNASGDEPQQNKAKCDKAHKKRVLDDSEGNEKKVLDDSEDNDIDSDYKEKTLHHPDDKESNDSDNNNKDKVQGSDEDDKYEDEDEDEDDEMLSKKYIRKCSWGGCQSWYKWFRPNLDRSTSRSRYKIV